MKTMLIGGLYNGTVVYTKLEEIRMPPKKAGARFVRPNFDSTSSPDEDLRYIHEQWFLKIPKRDMVPFQLLDYREDFHCLYGMDACEKESLIRKHMTSFVEGVVFAADEPIYFTNT